MAWRKKPLDASLWPPLAEIQIPFAGLLTQVYNRSSKRSDFALLDTDDIAARPVARIHLRHHVPVSFHGYWSPLRQN
jgi:hypothetical protein